MTRPESYLADGVYISFDGHQIRLRAPRENGDHVIYLDFDVLVALEQYLSGVVAAVEAHHE